LPNFKTFSDIFGVDKSVFCLSSVFGAHPDSLYTEQFHIEHIDSSVE